MHITNLKPKINKIVLINFVFTINPRQYFKTAIHGSIGA